MSLGVLRAEARANVLEAARPALDRYGSSVIRSVRPGALRCWATTMQVQVSQ